MQAENKSRLRTNPSTTAQHAGMSTFIPAIMLPRPGPREGSPYLSTAIKKADKTGSCTIIA